MVKPMISSCRTNSIAMDEHSPMVMIPCGRLLINQMMTLRVMDGPWNTTTVRVYTRREVGEQLFRLHDEYDSNNLSFQGI